MTDGKEYLRAGDIARLTGTTVRTVRRWIADKTIPSRRLGGARFVATADLEAALSASEDVLKESFDTQKCDEVECDDLLSGKH
jgi:excisionase family DNA binding protein